MDEDFFTKRFIECVKKPHEERDEQVYTATYIRARVLLCSMYLPSLVIAGATVLSVMHNVAVVCNGI